MHDGCPSRRSAQTHWFVGSALGRSCPLGFLGFHQPSLSLDILEFCGKFFSLEFFQLTACAPKEGVSGTHCTRVKNLWINALNFVCLFKMGRTVSRQGADSTFEDDCLQRILFFCQHALWQENEKISCSLH
jgi:hypothetical protein|nr:I54 protein [Mus musculus]